MNMFEQGSIEAGYDRLSQEFFNTYYTYYSPHATRQGLHQYDGALGHYQRDEIEETLRRMKAIQAAVAAIDPASMDHLHALDHPVLTTRIKREIYWIETWRFWPHRWLCGGLARGCLSCSCRFTCRSWAPRHKIPG